MQEGRTSFTANCCPSQLKANFLRSVVALRLLRVTFLTFCMSYLPQHFIVLWTLAVVPELHVLNHSYPFGYSCLLYHIFHFKPNWQWLRAFSSVWLPNDITQWSHKTVVFPPVFCIIEGCIWIKDNSILDLNCTLMKGCIFYVGIITIWISCTLYSTISNLIKSAQSTGHTYLMAQHALFSHK